MSRRAMPEVQVRLRLGSWGVDVGIRCLRLRSNFVMTLNFVGVEIWHLWFFYVDWMIIL